MPATNKSIVRWKWRKQVCVLYRAFGANPFTSLDATRVIGNSDRYGMFAMLREKGAMQLANGDKRSHYHKGNEKTLWQFTPTFIKYLESGGLKELESD